MFKLFMLLTAFVTTSLGGSVLAFGSPMLVATEASPSGLFSSALGQELIFVLESLAPNPTTWNVTVSTSAGWTATPSLPSVTLSSLAQARPTSLPVAVVPIDNACPPKGLVIQLVFTDPTREQ